MQWQLWMNTPNGWAYSQHELQLASVIKGSNGHQMSTLANKDPSSCREQAGMLPQAVTTCMSRADMSIVSLIHPPMHLEYFTSHERERRIMRKKEHYQKVLTQGKAKEHEHSNRAKKKGACRGWLEWDRCQGGTSSGGGEHEGKSSQARRWKKKKQETQAEQCPH